MKQIRRAIIAMIMTFMFAGAAAAIDINTLDKISVLMTKSEVLAILGAPNDTLDVGAGLKTEVYKLEGMDPMIGAGCIYDEGRLVGQSFMFAGAMTQEAAERLKKHGFTIIEEKGIAIKLQGKDGDRDRLLMVHVYKESGMTVVMVFEKDFYDKHISGQE